MRKVTSVLLAFVLCTALLCIGAAAADSGAAGKFAGGDGSPENPYKIENADQLKAVENDPDAHYELIADIDLEGSAENLWNPIGNDQNTTFTGTFDGNGHTISGLYMNAKSPDNTDRGLGLFSYLGSGGTIKNLTVEGEICPGEGVDGPYYYPSVGSVAGQCDGGTIINCTSGVNITGYTEGTVGGIVAGADDGGTIENCRYTGTIDITIGDTRGMGGIVGQASDCTVENCENAGTVISDIHTGGVVGRNNSGGEVLNCRNSGYVKSSGNRASGGVVGDNYGVIKNSYNIGTVTGSGGWTGGVTGHNVAESSPNAKTGGIVENCYNAGTVSVSGSGSVGGVVGHNNSSVSHTAIVRSSYNTGTVTGGSRTGGVVGYIESGVVENCYNTGDVTGSVDGSDAGGVVGRIEVKEYTSTVSDCYNTGDVTGGDTGGVVGRIEGNKYESTVSDCYNTGDVTGGGNAGGVVGSFEENQDESTVSNCYNTGDVTGGGNAGGVVGKMEDSELNTVSDCYYLAKDGLNGIGYGGDSDDDATPLTKDQFADPGSFPNLDFKDTWIIADMGGFKRPVLKGTQETALTYTVTVNGSCAEQSGAGKYSEGVSVTVSAGVRAGYRFAGWTASGVDLADASAQTVTFEMPDNDVTLTAEWNYIVIPGEPTYRPIINEPENGDVTTAPTRPEEGDTVTVSPEPDEGYEVDEIIVTDKDGNTVEVTRNPDGSYSFTQPEGAVTIEVTFRPAGEAEMPFTDVAEGDWFYDAVSYVYANGLMDGTSGTTFEPDANMTRAMVWAILARVDGETVTGEGWIETARTWAMANGVSDGTDAAGLVTREQLATMLWRYAGEPAAAGNGISAFTDAADASDWAIDGLNWALGQGIVTGMDDGILVPQGTATRAQAAAMLMRFVEL